MSLKQNIIYIYFNGKHLITSRSQYQYNHGQYLYFADLNLPQIFEVHFSNKDNGNSKTQIGRDKLVQIPDEYFWNGALMIYVWIYLHSTATDGETVYEVRIPLTKRAKPTDEEPEPEQQTVIDRAIAELNNAVNVTTENANQTSSDRTRVANIKEDIIDLKEEIDSTATIITNTKIDIEQIAETVDENAQSAYQSMESANEASESASQSANSASRSAGNASQSASEASQSEQNASQSESNASENAEQAEKYKNQAEQFKNQSETNVTHYPKIVDEYWYVWDASDGQYINTNINAHGVKGDKGDTGDKGAKGDKGDTGIGIKNTILNSDYTLTITFTDDTFYTTPSIRGEKGLKGDVGNGISSAILNNDYTLTLTFTNGTTYTTPSIRGEKGDKGDKIYIGDDGSIYIE